MKLFTVLEHRYRTKSGGACQSLTVVRRSLGSVCGGDLRVAAR